MMLDQHLLSLLTFVPLAGALALLLVPRNALGLIRGVALGTSGVALALALLVLSRFDGAASELQLVEKVAWIPTIRVDYFVAVDGISVLLVLLSAIVVPLAMLGSWSIVDNARTYFFLVLLMQTAMFGVFTALSFFHWFIFWELSLIPAFFLIKLWGGANAHKAAMRFFIVTLVGSVTMLLAFQLLFLATNTFDFIELKALARTGALPQKVMSFVQSAGVDLSMGWCSVLVFIAIALAFLVKAPLWPLHTWLPNAYAEAPASTTMLLTAVLSKMGVYGLLRILFPLFPDLADAVATPLLGLAVITVVAGALAALAQTDLKRMIAYSSMNHVGYCMVGVFAAMIANGRLDDRAAALDGVLLQMFNHGVTAAALFFLLGALEERTRSRNIDDFGGLRRVVPLFSLVFGIALFSSLGLPGLAGFVGEFLIFKGALALHTPLAAIALSGLVITTVFLLSIVQRVFWGPVRARWSDLADLSLRELFAGAVFVALIIFCGLYPGPLVSLVNATVVGFVKAFP